MGEGWRTYPPRLRKGLKKDGEFWIQTGFTDTLDLGGQQMSIGRIVKRKKIYVIKQRPFH